MENNTERSSHLLVFGLGYAATEIVKQLEPEFENISTTNRKMPESQLGNCTHLVFDGTKTDETLNAAINSATHILISIGPNESGDPVLNAARDIIAEADGVKWIGYLSTVGVYGNHDGAWIDEETVCKPVSKRSIERLAAEKAWRDLAKSSEIPLAIFRLSGIYGPGRNAMVNMDKGRSRRLIKKDQVFNRIRREDIAEGVSLAIAKNADGIFNITDSEPAPPQDVVSYVHALRGVTPPPEIDFETADITPMARSFYGENKRVSNAKSKTVLGLEYKWPNYRSSFDAMWKNKNWL